MNELMNAPLEGTVDIDPVFIEDMANKVRDTTINDFIAFTVAGGTPAPLEGELVDKGVEVKVYRDPGGPLAEFLEESIERRRSVKKEIIANQNALEGEFEQGPPADMRKLFLPGGGIDVFAVAAKAQRLVPKPAIEGELIKARDPGAGSHRLEDLSGRNTLKHAIQEIETAVEASHEISSTPSSAL